MGKHYGYDYEYACKYGSDIASIIEHFKYWIDSNRVRQINLKEDRTWTYQTVEYINNHYPWLSLITIKRALKKLVDEKILIKGHFHPDPRNRTTWYAFFDEDLMLGPSAHSIKMSQCTTMRVVEENHASSPIESHSIKMSQCIVSKRDDVISNTITIDTDTKEKIKEKEMSGKPDDIRKRQFFEKLKKRYPRREKLEKAWSSFKRLKRIDEVLLNEMMTAIDKQEEKRINQREANADGWFEAWPLLTSWINARRWEDEVYDPTEEIKKQNKLAEDKAAVKYRELFEGVA